MFVSETKLPSNVGGNAKRIKLNNVARFDFANTADIIKVLEERGYQVFVKNRVEENAVSWIIAKTDTEMGLPPRSQQRKTEGQQYRRRIRKLYRDSTKQHQFRLYGEV